MLESSNPLANVASPPQPQGPAQGNPLARLAGPLPGLPPQQPAPTAAQATAAVHRFQAVQGAMREVMQDPEFGKSNVRPVLLDAASKLIGSKLMSLPEVMNSISNFPDDPIKQADFVRSIFNNARQGEASVIDHHAAAVVSGKLPRDGGPKYDLANHQQHVDGLMGHYPKV